MTVFWIFAALMIGVALAIVLVPLLRARPPAGPSQDEANLAVLRGQRGDIERDVASGVLPPDARDEALADLAVRANADLAAGAPTAPAPARASPPWIAAALAGITLPALAIGLYLWVGTPAAVDPAATKAPAPLDDKQIVNLVENLAKKVKERPDDAQGWALLARSMGALGRFKEAAEAYAHLARLVPNDANVLADYADALGMAQGKNLSGKPHEVIRQALKIDPQNHKALALAGTVTLHEGDFAASLGHWQRLAAVVPPDSDDARRIAEVIEEVRDKAKAAGKALPAAPKTVAKAPAAADASVSGRVALAPDLAAKVAPADTLFIYARAEGGPRMPLAIIRGAATELPRDFKLDDSMAMSPAFKLSTAPAVRIEARITKSGSASAQPGDLTGTSDVVKPGTRGVKVVIDRVVP